MRLKYSPDDVLSYVTRDGSDQVAASAEPLPQAMFSDVLAYEGIGKVHGLRCTNDGTVIALIDGDVVFFKPKASSVNDDGAGFKFDEEHEIAGNYTISVVSNESTASATTDKSSVTSLSFNSAKEHGVIVGTSDGIVAEITGMVDGDDIRDGKRYYML